MNRRTVLAAGLVVGVVAAVVAALLANQGGGRREAQRSTPAASTAGGLSGTSSTRRGVAPSSRPASSTPATTTTAPPAGSAPVTPTSGSRVGAPPGVGSPQAPTGGPAAGTPPGGPAYSFTPQSTASGPAPATHLVTSDLTLLANQSLVETFSVTSAGSVSLHAFPSGSSSYNVSSLRACVQYQGEQPCAPTAFPNPAYWTISSGDLQQHRTYQLRVMATVSSNGQLVGLDVGWNGPHSVSISGLDLPGGCSGSSGYATGCGVRFRFNAGPGTATVSAGPGTLHLKMKDKSTGTVACDTKFTGSAACSIPYAASWTGYLYPEAGQPVPGASMTLAWP